MQHSPALKVLLLLMNLASILSLCFSTELRLFPTQAATTHRRYKKLVFSGVQVCYSLDSCYNNIAVGAAWLDSPRGSRFTFYEETGCSGKYLRMQDNVVSGSVDFTKVNFANKLSSFMLLDYSNYAVAGMIDICHEENAKLSETTANGSFQA
ncbi:hypothetical protein V7S43_017508 [Phytophthora oleae]|uniref:Uncharacterized protein n=1 Tax=Phytophthora oleae TaxID=2107226 RepID=A0ABD3ETP3_9STRA